MTRCTICAVLFGLLVSAATADESSKDATMKAFGMFVGQWEVVQPNGNTSKFSVEKSESGCYVMTGRRTTLVIGWDAKDDIVKATGFGPSGAFVHTWKHAGDGPKLEGTAQDGTSLTITFTSKDRYEFVMGDVKTVGERVK